MKIKIGVSGRHAHLTKKDLDILFGEGYELNTKKDLSQLGEFAAEETVVIKTEKSTFNSVRILGPVRNYTQVEISKTDAHQLGINPPVRRSGEVEGSAEVTIVGPKGEVTKACCIIANRHIHMNTEEAKNNNFKDLQKVSVYLNTEKSAILKDVEIKTGDNYVLELHVDTDDANANLVTNETEGKILEY